MNCKFENKSGITIIKNCGHALSILADARFHVPEFPEFLNRLRSAGVELTNLRLFVEISPFFLDGPRHRFIRDLCLQYLGSRAMKRWEPHIASSIEQILVSIQTDKFDVVENISRPIFTKVVRPILGLCGAAGGAFDETAMSLQRLIEPLQPIRQLRTIDAELGSLLNQVKHQLDNRLLPAESMLASLVADDTIDLSFEEKIALSITLYAAVAPLAQTISNAIHELCGPSYQRDGCSGRARDLVPKLVSVAAAPKYIHRRAASHVQLADISIPAGTTVLLDVEAVNSELRSAVPYGRKNLSFGFGAHACVGSAMSMSILTELLPKFKERFRDYRVVEWSMDTNNHIARSLTSLIMENSP